MSSRLNDSLLRHAFTFYGEREVEGAKNSPVISAMLRSVGLPARDSIAWCSAFVNLVAKIVGADRTNSGLARSWLDTGVCVGWSGARPGHIIILRRGKSKWQGHVGFVVRVDKVREVVWVLGGNQNNRVCIKPYPFRKVLGFRELGLAR